MDDPTASATSSSSPPPQRERQPQTFRSTASSDWRRKDESPRPEVTQRARGGGYGSRSQTQGQGHNGQSPASPGGDDQGTRLYVGNLLYTAQKSDVESVFTEQGFQVVNVSISTDPFTGRNPSYCFVDLDTAAEAQRAIAELNGVEVLGRGMRVSPGVARRNQGQTAQGDAAAGVNGREVRVRNFEKGSLHREERSGEYKPSFDRWNRTDASSHWQAPQSEGRRLYVGNLPRIEPQSALDEEIQSLFSTHLGNEGIVPAAVSKLISPHPSKASEPGNHYYCFVDLDKAEDSDVVIAALDGKQGSWGGNLRINKAREQNARKVTREQGLPREGSERKPFGGRWRTQE